MPLHEVLLVVAAALPANMIVWLYYRARWWATPLGKGMALTAVAVAAILDLVIVTRIWPESRDALRPVFTVLYLVLSAGLWLKYRAFRTLEADRRDQLRAIVRGPDHRKG